MTKSEILEKIKSVKRKLDEMRQYKIVMAEDGVKPDWDDKVLDALRIPRTSLPDVVDTTGVLGPASALDGTPLSEALPAA